MTSTFEVAVKLASNYSGRYAERFDQYCSSESDLEDRCSGKSDGSMVRLLLKEMCVMY